MIYLIDEDQLRRIQEISSALHNGTDAMRDLGHKLWLVINQVKEQDVPEELTQPSATGNCAIT